MAQRILVVDDSQTNLKAVTQILSAAGYAVETSSDGRAGLSRAEASPPDLLILDVQMPELDGYEVCRRLRRSPSFAGRPIMMLTANTSLQEKVQGLEAGADDYMGKPFEAEELQARVRALLRRSSATPALAPTSQGKVIGCFSLRGGVGVSTMAVNLAAGLSELWGSTALVDMVFTGGHSGLMLNLPLRYSWGDLATRPSEEIDGDMLDRLLLSHPCGLRVLPSAPRPEENEPVTAELVSSVLGVLRTRYRYVVLDLPHSFSGPVLAALDAADELVLLLAPEIGSVVAATCALDVFGQLGYSREHITPMLNVIFERGGLARKDIERTLGRPLTMVMPFAHDLFTSALNRGVPPVLEMPTKPLGAILEDWAFSMSSDEHRNSPAEHASPALERVRKRSALRQKAR
jgi:pilus assembly protein CpaE